MKKLFWFLFSFILLFWITNATTINFWLTEFDDEVWHLFQTDFKTDKNLINLKFCWDYNNDDELYLMKWTTKFNWIKYWSCFEFGFVPSDTYSLYLSWWTLKSFKIDQVFYF